MTEREMINKYFNWLCDFTVSKKIRPIKTYRKLLALLHDIEFIPIIPNDENRAQDGIDLRLRFSRRYNCDYYNVQDFCSVLEMMIALALRCEEQIMCDPEIGNRTYYWFSLMIENLGLSEYTDDKFTRSNEPEVVDIINRFIDRDYEPNGRGGLFVIDNFRYDLRDEEIWNQMCWYLNTLM